MKKAIGLTVATITTLVISSCGMSNLSYYKNQPTAQVEKEHHAILTKWDVRKTYFVPLIIPSALLMGR